MAGCVCLLVSVPLHSCPNLSSQGKTEDKGAESPNPSKPQEEDTCTPKCATCYFDAS